MDALLSVAEAQQRVLAQLKPTETVNIPLAEALGRVLAIPVQAAHDLPPYDNSSMDGFAVKAADVQSASLATPVVLQVVEDIPAGQVPTVRLEPGQAARIMTGAMRPEGSDAVVPVEDTDFSERHPGSAAPQSVSIYRAAMPGEALRRRGQDVHSGENVLLAGTRLRPQEIGFLAMLGVNQVPVHRSPRVAIFSTGNELVPVDQSLVPGKIHDANTYALQALVAQYGGIPVNLGVAPDHEEAVTEVLELAVEAKVDLILSSAGVSVGAFDYVRQVVERQGELVFWRVNMRPGKPLTFGHYHQVPFIGLPGNPVSAFIGFLVFARPAIQRLAGAKPGLAHPVDAILAEAVESDGRESYLRAVLSPAAGGWSARLTGHQGSGNLRSLVQANALLLVPSGVKFLPIGASVQAWLLDAE